MKSLSVFFTCIALITTSAAALAQEKAPLGNGNIALKLAYINFTNDFFDSPNTSNGVYIGIEGYGKIAPNLYFGGEVGNGINIDLIGGEDIDFIPLEVNVKYATEFASNLVVDFGAGFSYSKVDLKRLPPLAGSAEPERDDWLLGGQFFTDLTYKINWFSLGVNAKYQLTEDFKDENLDLSNWRLGFHIGIIF